MLILQHTYAYLFIYFIKREREREGTGIIEVYIAHVNCHKPIPLLLKIPIISETFSSFLKFSNLYPYILSGPL